MIVGFNVSANELQVASLAGLLAHAEMTFLASAVEVLWQKELLSRPERICFFSRLY